MVRHLVIFGLVTLCVTTVALPAPRRSPAAASLVDALKKKVRTPLSSPEVPTASGAVPGGTSTGDAPGGATGEGSAGAATPDVAEASTSTNANGSQRNAGPDPEASTGRQNANSGGAAADAAEADETETEADDEDAAAQVAVDAAAGPGPAAVPPLPGDAAADGALALDLSSFVRMVRRQNERIQFQQLEWEVAR